MATKTKKPVAKVTAPKPRPAPKPPKAKVVAPVVEEVPDIIDTGGDTKVDIEPAVEMEDFHFGGYVVQAPKGCTPLYSESHPILGLTKVVFQTAMAAGDGRPNDPAGQYVWRK